MRAVIIAAIVVSGITLTYFMSNMKAEKPLEIINPTDVPEEMVDSSLVGKGLNHTIQDFNLTDQNGKAFGLKDLKGKVFVAEYFFTTCGTICPKMNAQMQKVQEAFGKNERVEILSFTVDPEVDTPEKLKEYAVGHGANDKQWHFLTGSKEAIYKSARRSFFTLKPAEAQNQGDVGSDFIHTNNFVLVDKHLQIRGYYDGTSSKDVAVLIYDIKRLLQE